ncbi:hypothetical protein MPL1032_210095 [Mesorhizobium plurifarium]|uniref:Uncharacterized protein n=1 Tax=Mesorhizobium plurifarium TaxID=69974 RepID=A0A0K2VZE1_MESPL|nr:hypothetical protein MPL1032_210095 [Mesorhizobium plurifarium]
MDRLPAILGRKPGDKSPPAHLLESIRSPNLDIRMPVALREGQLADRRVRGKARVKRRRASTALRDRFNRTVNRQAGGFILMLFNILFHFTLQLRTGSGCRMPPAYGYAAMRLLHGNIHESSLIYQPLINSWLRSPSLVIKA